jgi:hypothetical protein
VTFGRPGAAWQASGSRRQSELRATDAMEWLCMGRSFISRDAER